jgi:catechol 2,3-dioxygenase-like lactoylglutathione lyase family enzyme
MAVTALRRVGRNVSDLDAAAEFYAAALGFQPAGPVTADGQLAALLGVASVRQLRMRLGAQEIELTQCFPPSAPYPRTMRANDPGFQHIAIITTAIDAASRQALRLGAEPISQRPVRLPASSGGVCAYKFRDPDGHPLEFLQFPDNADCPPGGISGFDHSAISVTDVARSIAFYTALGLTLGARQLNHGAAQDTLDGLQCAIVDVVALYPEQATPHVELLGYRAPEQRFLAPAGPADLCADRLIFDSTDGALTLLHDPDRHVILIDGR